FLRYSFRTWGVRNRVSTIFLVTQREIFPETRFLRRSRYLSINALISPKSMIDGQKVACYISN
ncbi:MULTISPECIES: hypothetical protein, partial [unclassified Microcoleus]